MKNLVTNCINTFWNHTVMSPGRDRYRKELLKKSLTEAIDIEDTHSKRNENKVHSHTMKYGKIDEQRNT